MPNISYDEYYGDGGSTPSLIDKINDLGKAKYFIFLVIILLFLIPIFLFVISPSMGVDPFSFLNLKESKVRVNSEGVEIGFSGSLSINGEIVDTFNNNSPTLIHTNSGGRITIPLNIQGFSPQNSSGRITILNSSGGVIIVLDEDDFVFDDEGNLLITFDPEDLGFDFEDENIFGDSGEFILQIELENEDDEELVIHVPIVIMFQEFIGTGCLALTRQSVSQTTQYGILELNAKIKVMCETNSDLEAYVDWRSERAGPVEILFSDYGDGTSLVGDALVVKENVSVKEYLIKIYFAPSKQFAGQKASFKVGFKLDNSEQVINFNIAMENLEQCVEVTSDDLIIEGENDKASITVSTQKCFSDKINIHFCDNDYGCSGGTNEGEIALSQGKLSMGRGQTKTITISRGDMAGVFGVVVEASIPGMEKTFIDEKEILVLPSEELVFPEKFAVSLIGNSKDFMYVRNKALAEDVSLNTSVCDLYTSYTGITSVGMPLLGYTVAQGDSWLHNLFYASQAGKGLYQSSLANTMQSIYTSTLTTKSISFQENSKLKKAFIGGKEMEEGINDVYDLVSRSVDAANELDDAIGEKIDLGESSQILMKISSMASSLASLYSGAISLCTDLTLAATTANTISTTYSGCAAISGAFTTTVPPALTSAKTEQCGSLVSTSFQLVNDVSTLYSLYQQIESLSKDNQTINANDALDYTNTAMEKVEEAKRKTESMVAYLDLALDSASIDSLTKASENDLDSKRYFELAQQEAEEIYELLLDIREAEVSADDELTVMLSDDVSNTDLYIQATQLLISIIDLIGILGPNTELISTEITTAQTASTTAITAATSEGCCGCTVVGNKSCCGAPEMISGSLVPKLAYAKGALAVQESLILQTMGYANLIYSAFELYQGLANDYTSELVGAKTSFSETLGEIDDIKLGAANTVIDLKNAVSAAHNLSINELKSSTASGYESENFVSGNFNKKRLNGLLGSFVSGAFVSGAKEGGVYSTTLDMISVDCSNQVELTLPDFVINLKDDAKSPLVSTGDVIAQWSFDDTKVFDVFEEQQAGIIFSKSGLKENKYAILELKVNKHLHDNPSIVSGNFGPFNIPDSSIEEVSYKFHIKLNAKERKSAESNTSAICEKGLMFGQTGEDALPNIVLGWNWENINSEVAKENYLDATQLSILLSKKLSVLDEFLSKSNYSCPENYSYDILKQIVPSEIELVPQSDCYLPMTTNYYDGKPALYYYLNSVAQEGEYHDSFFDEPLISDAEEMLEIVEFNANLIWDGYGTNFQTDFASEYRNTLFKANTQFLDPNYGAYKYFSSTSKLFYSSPAIGLTSSRDFIIPDAGKYKVRMLIDFSNSPRIYYGGTASAKIIFELTLLEPINNNYSPFFYTPIDDGVGTRVNNNRQTYGTSLLSGENFPVQKTEGVYIRANQQKALEQVSLTELGNFFWLNSLASRRAKILEYSYNYFGDKKIIFSPTLATPLLMEIPANGGLPYIEYIIMRGKQEIKAKSNSLLLLSGLEDCKDFYGGELSKLVSNLPDYKLGDNYGVVFSETQNTGKVYLRTIAYTPVEDSYGLAYTPESGSLLMSPNVQTEGGLVYLQGIKGMNYNYAPDSAVISDLTDLFKAVSANSVCVSQLGNKEIYWWPEEYLYEKKTPEGVSIRNKETNAKTECIK